MRGWMEQLGPKANGQKLQEILRERDFWWRRKSAQKWMGAEHPLPPLSPEEVPFSVEEGRVTLQSLRTLTPQEKETLGARASQLIPWKKGPFQFFHLGIDAEWRSDQKWERLEKYLGPLGGKKILDVGCNNGYFLYRMAALHPPPQMMLGLDPVLPFKAQFDLIQHYARIPNLSTELLGIEHLPLMIESFDLCLFMGIIYHHRNPMEQLLFVREALKPGGQVILETIGIPGEDSIALFPSERYARMANVWFIPTLNCFINWTKKARFTDVQVLSATPLEEEEQRLTEWCPPPRQSLKESLDPHNPQLTLEGHPAPWRFMLSARRKK